MMIRWSFQGQRVLDSVCEAEEDQPLQGGIGESPQEDSEPKVQWLHSSRRVPR